ncbi:MAG: SEL1-like repeat protein [Alphaproteobacteria bacterium]|nr:SEL1-like repeat protein [Alphaproteobacteria bacterium]
MTSLETLGRDLGSEGPVGVAQPFARLDPEPVLFAGSASGLSRGLATLQPNAVMQARLEAAQSRNLALRDSFATRRAMLGREIARIADDLSVATDSLAGLEASLASVADGPIPDVALDGAVDGEIDTEVKTEVDSALLAGPAPDVVSAPETQPEAVAVDANALGAGKRAYAARDYARAYALWRPLAEAGTPMAQFHLGALYFEGRGVPRDLSQARTWLNRALGQGVERARFLLSRVEKGLARAG